MTKQTAAIKRHRTARLARLASKAYILHRKKQNQAMYTLICEEFVSLGGVYLKFLQGVLLRSKIMREWQSDDKLRIFEQIPSEPMNIQSVLRAELPPHLLAQIALVQPQPFAAGTFGQVYFAELANKKQVIIKVLRPMIRDTLKYDLKLLNTFMRKFYIKITSQNMDTDSKDALRDFAEATMRETDYITEVDFALELYEEYKVSDTITIPFTHRELSTKNIIVQEYLPGISVAQLMSMKQQGVDIQEYVKTELNSDLNTQLENLGFELLRGAFSMPRIQGDPHPGNIKILANNKVGLIDFGINAKTPDDKAAFFAVIESYDGIFNGSSTITDLFEKSLRFFVRDLYKALMTISKYAGEAAEKALPKQIGMIAEKSFERMTGKNMIDMNTETDAGTALTLVEANKIFNEGNRFGLIMKFEESAIIRSTQSFNSLLLTLGVFKTVMPKITTRVIEYVKINYPEALKDSATVPLGDAIETVTNWLERIAAKDPELFAEITAKIKSKKEILSEEPSHA